MIKTTIDPKELRTKYNRIKVRYGEGEITADTEIINESYDDKTKLFTMEMVLHYPRRSTTGTISLAIRARKDGQKYAITPLAYRMTQQDFDAMIRGEMFDVPVV